MDISTSGQIAYLQNDTLFLADANGGSLRPFLPVAGCPSWSPDGRQIAFALNGLYVVNVETRQIHQLRDDLHVYGKGLRRYLEALAWSPDGNKLIALAGGWGGASLVAFDVATADRFVLAGYSTTPAWSRDGQVIYTANPDYACELGQPPYLARVDIRLNQPASLLGGSEADLRGGFAPFETADGRLLALTSRLEGTPCGDTFPPVSVFPAQMALSAPGAWQVDSNSDHLLTDPRETLWWQDGSLVVAQLKDGSLFAISPFTDTPKALLSIRGSNLRWGK
jgi:hypothetical protein